MHRNNVLFIIYFNLGANKSCKKNHLENFSGVQGELFKSFFKNKNDFLY